MRKYAGKNGGSMGFLDILRCININLIMTKYLPSHIHSEPMDDLVHVPSVHLEVQLEHGLPDVLVVFFAATHLEICSGKSANTWFQMILKSSSCMSVTHHFPVPSQAKHCETLLAKRCQATDPKSCPTSPRNQGSWSLRRQLWERRPSREVLLQPPSASPE